MIDIENELGIWRANLPQELIPPEPTPSHSPWDPRDTCIPVMHLLSRHIEIVLYRSVVMRMGESAESVMKISRTAFEGRQLMQYAMVRNVTCFMPPFM
jgi:hypothetical protein